MLSIKYFLSLSRKIAIVGFTLITAVAVAQNPPADVCATIVRSALSAVNAACTETSRNEACYGNTSGQAIAAEGVDDLIFENVGDIAAINQIQTLLLSPLDPDADEWGVALMQLQANLPDTRPGQNVTFLLFGDVTVEANTGEQVRIDAVARTGSNLRLAPTTTAPIVGSVDSGTAVVATGKAVNLDGELWLRVRNEAYRTATGWILADLIDVDVDALPDVPSDSLTLNPMQAFYFRTGIGKPQCATAPANGVVVQTPEGAGRVNFNVNGLDIDLGSTVFLTAPEGQQQTCISLVEGDADLFAANKGVDLEPGERSCAPINDDGTSGPPGDPEPYDEDEIDSIGEILDSLPDPVDAPDQPTAVPTNTPVTGGQAPVTVQRPTVEPTSTPVPTATNVPVQPTNPPPPRYVEVNQSRAYTEVTLTANAGPDAPDSYRWQFGEGSTGGKSATFYLYPGANESVRLRVCWADGECIVRDIVMQVPQCPIDYRSSGSITLYLDGYAEREHAASTTREGEEYIVFVTSENCQYNEVGRLNSANSQFSSSTHIGERWQVRTAANLSIVKTYEINDTSHISDSIPGGEGRP